MTKLLWDKVGERFYETGIDRGVLYLSDKSGVPWSGLTSVDEDFGGDGSEPRYLDGIKYLDEPSFGDFSASLSAFTCPDEFLDYEGTGSLGNGLFVDDQAPKAFGLSYRTRIENDIETEDYKIHILYNLMATPGALSHNSLSESISPVDFTWQLSSIPADAPGYRPTAHIIFDSRYLGISRLTGLEDILYGSATSAARLPDLSELIGLMTYWNPKSIVPRTITGLAELYLSTPNDGDLSESDVEGVYEPLPNTGLTESTVPGIYELTP